MTQELLSSLEYIEKEKGIRKGVLLEALRQALVSACRKSYPSRQEFEIEIDPITCNIRLMAHGKEVHDVEFGRIAAQTAKQIGRASCRERV